MINLKNFILGKPLKNDEIQHERLSRTWGLPIMSSDAVSSVAYAIEEILIVLIPVAGMAAFNFVSWVVVPIMLLLLIIIFSYLQIIDNYPQGGGAYAVLKETLGEKASLLTASALIVDYIMTVAVSISASSAAITSAFPALSEHTVGISILSAALITFINLRGVREASKIFGMPTYIFIGCMAVLIITGMIKLFTGNLHQISYPESVIPYDTVKGVGAVILLKAFSSGCSAMTGVEAVSNSVPSFKDPAVKNAKSILITLGLIIVFIFSGTSILAVKLKVMPMEGHTVLSQISSAVFGHSVIYYIIQIFTSLILLLAANTAYNGLPQLLYILAHDGYVPRQFSTRGTKLSFSNGIMFIFVAASLLIIAYKADVNGLIALYSVGVFISFTVAQLGMLKKWLNTKSKGWRHKFIVNGVGALTTFIVSVIVLFTKFTDGAWILVIAIPFLMTLMLLIKKHYTFVGKQLSLKKFRPYYKEKSDERSSQCILLVHDINKPFLKAINYANAIFDEITAVHVCRHPEHAEELRKKWDELQIPVKLEIIETPYREIIKPLDNYLWKKEKQLKHGENISVIIIKFVSEHWFDGILHNPTTYFLEKNLSLHKNISTIILPFHYRFDKDRLKNADNPEEQW